MLWISDLFRCTCSMIKFAHCLPNPQDWEQAVGVARAFKLGKLESEAVSNLQCRVPEHIVAALSEAVRTRGLSKLVTHELLAKDLLNKSFSSGLGQMEAWKEELRNKPNNKIAA